MLAPLTLEERSSILGRHREARERYERDTSSAAHEPPWSDAESRAVQAADTAFRELKQVEVDYLERLPRAAMSCCPFDGRPLMRSIDPFGVDGPWWQSAALAEEPVPCPHFCVLLGALQSGELDGLLQPSIPYVVPRLLQWPSTIAVLGQLTFTEVPRIYTIAYFAERRPPPELLTADWPRRNFVYTTQRATNGWRPASEIRDFELLPWLQNDKLRWCAPGNIALAQDSPDRCPYLRLGANRK
jgi:hypothetical protein